MATTQKIEKIAFAISKCPGSYALLLGSGMSRSAGIMTGHEITLDLINKIPKNREINGEELEQWYTNTYDNEEPSYDNVLDRISSKQVERRNILNSYFEPTEEEILDLVKIPQPGHYAIADLVKTGHIKVILTTNFDRLIESALMERGIQPYVIHSEGSYFCFLPPAHIKNSCIIFKIHGDYRDSQILNTKSELANYEQNKVQYLEKIIQDFGLLIVGWSSKYDVALRNIIKERKNSLFGIYWAIRDNKDSDQIESITELKAQSIKIEDADHFFEELRDTIYAIDTAEESVRPISANIAIGRIKQYIAQKNHVKIYDFVNHELLKVHTILSSSQFEVDSNKIGNGVNFDEIAKSRISTINRIMKPLLGMTAAITFFDETSPSHLIENIARKITIIRKWGQTDNDIRDIQYYPFFLLISVVGIVSILANRYESLNSLLYRLNFTHENIRGSMEKEQSIYRCNSQNVGYNHNRKIIDNYLEIEKYLLNDVLSQYIGSEYQFRENFLKYKYLVASVFVDIKNYENHEFTQPKDLDLFLDDIRVLIDIMSSKDVLGRSIPDYSLTYEFYREVLSYYNSLTGECRWAAFQVGMFQGNFERFRKSADILQNQLSPIADS